MTKKRQCKLCQRIAGDNGYCNMHQTASEPKQDSKQRAGKTWRTRKARAWRDRFLADHPYCMDCMKIYGQPVPAMVVHHVIPQEHAPERALDPTNCVALCDACHDVRHHKTQVKAT